MVYLTCPDKLNIRHLKHIGPLGFAFLTSCIKTALNNNIIPHIWKLVNIVSIAKPNKHIDKGTSYRPKSLLSVIAKTLQKSPFLYITANILNTPTQHGHTTQHSTGAVLYTLNDTVAKGFNQMAPPSANNHDMCKSSDTINIHTLIRKLLQTNISGPIIKFIVKYINGRKTNTTYRHSISLQRQFKLASSHPNININTSDLSPPRASIQVMTYTDDITIRFTHTSTSAAK